MENDVISEVMTEVDARVKARRAAESKIISIATTGAGVVTLICALGLGIGGSEEILPRSSFWIFGGAAVVAGVGSWFYTHRTRRSFF